LLRVVPQERKYSNAELAKLLEVPEATLRTYKSHFTKAGINFNKEGKQIIYTEEQVRLFKDMLKLHRKGNQTIKECVVTVVNEVQHVESVVKTGSTHSTNTTDETITHMALEDLLERVKTLENQSSEQGENIDFLNGELSRMPERDKKLMSVIRDIQTVKSELEAAKKKKWWQFWK
jgi:DNA-binding transcriptional MerR regulator